MTVTVPTSYTEATLKAFMHATIGAVADSLEWTTVGTKYDEAMIETLLAYGVTDIANATDIKKLRALARREVWRSVLAEVSSDIDFSADGARYSQQQLFTMAQQQFQMASADATPFDSSGSNVVSLETVNYGDPYMPLEEETV
jgi:hypothetical protein